MPVDKIPTTSSLKRDASGTEVPSVEALAEGMIVKRTNTSIREVDKAYEIGFEIGVKEMVKELRRRDAQVVAGCENKWNVVTYEEGGPDFGIKTDSIYTCGLTYRCPACIRTINSHEPPLTEKEIKEAKHG